MSELMLGCLVVLSGGERGDSYHLFSFCMGMNERAVVKLAESGSSGSSITVVMRHGCYALLVSHYFKQIFPLAGHWMMGMV